MLFGLCALMLVNSFGAHAGLLKEVRVGVSKGAQTVHKVGCVCVRTAWGLTKTCLGLGMTGVACCIFKAAIIDFDDEKIKDKYERIGERIDERISEQSAKNLVILTGVCLFAVGQCFIGSVIEDLENLCGKNHSRQKKGLKNAQREHNKKKQAA